MPRRSMRKCRSGNALEMAFRRELGAALGPAIRFEARDLPGTPDAACDATRTAVFLHGCFWHGCPKHYKPPRRNARFWREKRATNAARDARAVEGLRAMGWRVLVIWEHEMRLVGAWRVVKELRGPKAGARGGKT